jgi:hypothetical protein
MIVAMLAACEKVSDTDKDSDEQNLFRRNAEKNFYNFK